MKLKSFFLILLAVSIAHTVMAQGSQAASGKEDMPLIQKCFDDYKDAILNDRSDEAVILIDKGTAEYFDAMTQKIRSAEKSEVMEESFMNKFLILGIRHQAPEVLLKNGSGNDFLIYAMQDGLLGKKSLKNYSLGEVQVTGDRALADLLVGGNAMGLKIGFRQEDSDWKVDMLEVLNSSAEMLKSLQGYSGLEENEYILMTLDNMSGKKTDDTLWDPQF